MSKMLRHPTPDAIADTVLQAFNALPSKFKPRKLADGRRERVPLAGIVLSMPGRRRSTDTNPKDESTATNKNGNGNFGLKCVSLATGMKCLPQSKVEKAKGNVLHDSHAEVLAIRAFNRWLVDECSELARRGFVGRSEWVRWRQQGLQNANVEGQWIGTGGGEAGKQPFELQPDVGIHMFCSECPCGDASMELTMASQEDATPWIQAPPSDTGMLGRGHFDQLGVVRRKPARGDAPLTFSKSCSDKLALKQVTGLLSGVVTRLVWPESVYLSTLVMPEAQIVERAVERAWGRDGRMAALKSLDEETKVRWLGAGYGFKPFEVKGTTRTFVYSKSPVAGGSEEPAVVPSNLSTISTPHTSEILINGVLQGRKQFDPKGASSVSRRRMLEAVLQAAGSARDAAKDENGVAKGRLEDLVRDLGERTYGEAKREVDRVRQEVKAVTREVALKGWQRGEGDSGWTLEDT